MSPVANDNIKPERENAMEPFYPLHVYVCGICWLVQLPNIRKENEVFTDEYAYFSSYSTSWLAHAKEYVDMMMKRFVFSTESLVIELASNDGYLLQYFKEKHVPVLGVEPTKNTAAVAAKKGIPSITKFFGVDTAKEMVQNGKKADLLLGNNVLAHVPDLNDFIKGMKIVLKDKGIITMEFPHLLQLIEKNQFDTIYHEHFSYFSFTTVEKIFAQHGIVLFDVEEISTHGGSLRIYGKHAENKEIENTGRVSALKEKEKASGLGNLETYTSFSEKVKETKRLALEFLIKAKRDGKKIIAYGAPAKGNTFLNYCGIGTDFIDFTVDKSPHKQNMLLPGSHIPIRAPEDIRNTKPDYIVVLPWNLKDEIVKELGDVHADGAQFVVAIPRLEVLI
jgi:SAM-dependent methyltransferase